MKWVVVLRYLLKESKFGDAIVLKYCNKESIEFPIASILRKVGILVHTIFV